MRKALTFSVKQKGNFFKTETFLKRAISRAYLHVLDKYAKEGVRVLSSITPVNTGLTAASWDYEITKEDGVVKVIWKNYNVQKYVNIALILQYGHATRSGSWYEGYDYINPAIQPIFDKIAESAWKEVIDIK